MDEIDGNISKMPLMAGEGPQSYNSRTASQVNGKMATRVGQALSGAAPPSATPQNMQDVSNIAKTLGMDVVDYYTKKGANNNNNRVPVKYARTLRRTVDELSDRHDILFKGMVNKLGITRQNCSQIFTNIAEELFRDGKYNWGRVVSVYAFSGRLARYCVENNLQDCAEIIGHLAGDFVAKKLGSWITEQGGWDAFDEYFPDQHSFEEKVWKGLLFTAVGLGALATMVAVR